MGAVMLKFMGAVLTAAAFAGLLTLLSAPTSARLEASSLAEPKEASLQPCTDRPWPYLNCIGSPLGNPHIRLLTTDHLTTSAVIVRGSVSDARILLETSQIQDW